MNQRFYSLDVFRGATVALMILVNNPGSWANIYSPLKHAPWHGCTPTDLVFPFFLFAVGNALAFVLPRLQEAGTSAFLTKVIKRTLLIFAIGLFLNWSPFIKWKEGKLVAKTWVDALHPDSGIRILGVLQRIALSYFFASLIIYFFKIRGAFFCSIIILLGYWALCLVLGAPYDQYSLEGYFGTGLDKAILHVPHMYKEGGISFDPEGIASTLPAIVQVIFGYFVGNYILQKGKNYETKFHKAIENNNYAPYDMLSHLFIAGSLLIFTGFMWHLSFPINKKIWTSSYVLYTSGLATVVLAVLIYLVELRKANEQKGIRQVMKFFDVFGKNALFIFFLSGFLPRILALFRWVDHIAPDGKKIYTSAFPWFYQNICKPVSEDLKNGSLLYALCMIIFYWLIVYWMDKKKIYIKV